MKNQKKGQKRKSIKEKTEESNKETNKLELEPEKYKWSEYPSLQRSCRVTLKNLKVERGPDQDVAVNRSNSKEPEGTGQSESGHRIHAKDYYKELLQAKLQKKNKVESAKLIEQAKKKTVPPKKTFKSNKSGPKSKTVKQEETEPAQKKTAPKRKSSLSKSEPKSKTVKQDEKPKIPPETGPKDEYIFIDFELSKSRRISEINTLLRTSGETHQISSLPPNSLARAFLQYLSSCSHHRLTAVFLCVASMDLFTELLARREKDPGKLFHAWTDLNSLVRRQLDSEDLKGVQLEANRLEMLYSQVSNSDIKTGSVPRTSRMKEIFEYKSLHREYHPRPWNPQPGKHVLAILGLGLLEGEGVFEVGSLSLLGEGWEWEEGIVPTVITSHGPHHVRLGLQLLEPSGRWILEGEAREAKGCVGVKDVIQGLLTKLEEEVAKAKADGVLLVTLWEDGLAHLLSLAARHGVVGRLRKLLKAVTSIQQVWRKVKDTDMTPKDISFGRTDCADSAAEAKAGHDSLKSLLGDNDLLPHCCLLSSTRINWLLCDASDRLMLPQLSEAVSAAVLVSPLMVEAGRMAVVNLSVRPELRGHCGSQYDLEMVQEQHKSKLRLGVEVLSSSGQGGLTMTLTNIAEKKVKIAAGSVFGMVRRIEDMDTELENEMLRGRRKSEDVSEGEEIEKSSSTNEEEKASEKRGKKRKVDEDDSNVMISLDLLRETLTKELKARGLSPDKSKIENVDVNCGTEQVKINEERKENSDSSDLNQFLDLAETLDSKDMLTDLSELQPSDLEISNWEDLNSTLTLDGIDMAAGFDIVDFSENPLTNLDSVVESMDGSPKVQQQSLPTTEALDQPAAQVGVDISKDSKIGNLIEAPRIIEVTHDLQLVSKETPASKEPCKQSVKPKKMRSIEVSESESLVSQLSVIHLTLPSMSLDQEQLSDQFPCLLGQETFAPLLLTLVKFTGVSVEELDFQVTDFGDKLVMELQSLNLDSLDEMLDTINAIHNENPAATLADWKEKFNDKFEHFKGINEMVGDNFDTKAIQLILLHFVKKLNHCVKLNTSVDTMLFFGGFLTTEEGEPCPETGPSEECVIPDIASEEVGKGESNPDLNEPIVTSKQEAVSRISDLIVQEIIKARRESMDETQQTASSKTTQENVNPLKKFPEKEHAEIIQVAVSKTTQENVNTLKKFPEKEYAELIQEAISKTTQENVNPLKKISEKEQAELIQEAKIPIGVQEEKSPKENLKIEASKKVEEVESSKNFIDPEPCKLGQHDLAPLNPENEMSNIYLAVKDDFVGESCKIMALKGEDPFYAMFSSSDMILHGKKADSTKSVKDTLAENGEDDDLILVHIPNLLPLSDTQFSSCAAAIPLSSWTDGRWFFDGFVLFHSSKENVCLAFMQGDQMKTVQITKETIKQFEMVADLKCLEPGLEVKLMVKDVESEPAATLCLPNPEKKFYDLLDITNWGKKTRRHLTDEETQADITDSFRKQVTIQTVMEKQRQFLLIKASNKTLAFKASKLLLDTKCTFEKLPGMKPRADPRVEVFMEFLPESLQATDKFLEELVHVGHYTGTSVKLVDGEVLIEGQDQAMVLLARDLLNHNIGLAVQSPVLGTSSGASGKQKKGESSTAVTPKKIEARVNSKVAEPSVVNDDSEVSSTTDGQNPPLQTSLGKEVGEGCVVQFTEVSNVPENIELVPLTDVTSEENVAVSILESDQKLNIPTQDSPENHIPENDNKFNVVLEKNVTIRAKSVAFADAVVKNADLRICDQVHEIKRHPAFSNSNIFIPERQKKRIGIAGKLKISLRNKTDNVINLDQGIMVCQITLNSPKTKDETISGSNTVEKEQTLQDDPNFESQCIDKEPEIVSIDEEDDDDIQIVDQLVVEPEKSKQTNMDRVELEKYLVKQVLEEIKSNRDVHKSTTSDKEINLSSKSKTPDKVSSPKGKSPVKEFGPSSENRSPEKILDPISKRITLEKESVLKDKSPVKEFGQSSKNKKPETQLDKSSKSNTPETELDQSSKSKSPETELDQWSKSKTPEKESTTKINSPVKEIGSSSKCKTHEKESIPSTIIASNIPSTVSIQQQPCSHSHMEEEACVKSLMSGGDCKYLRCSSKLQHTFSEDFLQSLEMEFCMRHLRNKICTKRSLPPFICPSKRHVDSAEPLKAFYGQFRNSIYENCINCRGIYRKSSSKQATKITEKAKNPNDESVIEAKHLTKPSVEPKQPTKSSVEPEHSTKPSVEPEHSTKPSVEPKHSTKPYVEPDNSTMHSVEPENSSKPSVESEHLTKCAVEPPYLTKPSCEPKLSIQGEESKEVSFKDHCPHIKFRMILCKFRDKAKCPVSGCTDVHIINEVLKIEFCQEFLKDPSKCQSSTCKPHMNLSQLQEKYHLAIRARVVNCSRCIFRCKHFNTANLLDKEAKPCLPDLQGKCLKIEDGRVVCKFIHMSEVEHLGVTKKNSGYEEAFQRTLTACKGFCKTCKSEMAELKSRFERSLKQVESSDKPVESTKTVDKNQPKSTISKLSEAKYGSLETKSGPSEVKAGPPEAKYVAQGTKTQQKSTISKPTEPKVGQPKSTVAKVGPAKPTENRSSSCKVPTQSAQQQRPTHPPMPQRPGPSYPPGFRPGPGHQMIPGMQPPRGVCRSFWNHGNCRFGTQCRYQH